MGDGEYWDTETRQWLTETGRTREEQRAFDRGYNSAGEHNRTWAERSYPTASQAPELPSYTGVQAPRVIARGDRGTWMRESNSGRLRSVYCPDDPEAEAKEMQAARAFADDWEYRYGRRPSMTECRMAVREPPGLVFPDLETFTAACRQAGIPLRIVQEMQPLPGPEDSLPQPVRRG